MRECKAKLSLTNSILQREMLVIFMGLLRQGLIRPHFTMHDMMEYLAYQEKEAFMERSD